MKIRNDYTCPLENGMTDALLAKGILTEEDLEKLAADGTIDIEGV